MFIGAFVIAAFWTGLALMMVGIPGNRRRGH